MSHKLNEINLDADLDAELSSVFAVDGGNISAELLQSNTLSNENVIYAKSFVTNYAERPAYTNGIPYAASIVAGKKNDISACNLNTSIVYGESNVISGEGKPSVGSMFVGGMKNNVTGNSTGTVVVGGQNVLSAASNYSAVFGQENKVKAENSFIAGVNNIVSDTAKKAFVLGWSNKVDVTTGTDGTVIVLGKNATATHNGSFVWNGAANNGATTEYATKAAGSFNVNPVGQLSGFYIGADNFITCVVKAIQSATAEQKAAIKTALGLAD